MREQRSFVRCGEMAEFGLRRTTGNRVYGEPYQGFESLSLRHEKSLFCLPRQERFFPAFRAKNKQIYAISGFGAVDRLLRSPIFCVQRRKRSQNAGVLFAVLCRCKERLKRTEGTDLNQLFTKNIHSSKDLITLMLRYNTWVTNKKQEKVLLWYNLIRQTTIERRTNSCARIIPQKLTIVNVCLSME